MVIKVEGGIPRHYPEGEVFSFDAEVSSIFPDMATRSIPLYHEMHRLHSEIAVSFLSSRLPEHRQPTLLDIGASRGQFLRSMHEAAWPGTVYENDMELLSRAVSCTAIESSPHMAAHLRSEFPGLRVEDADLSVNEECRPLGQFDVVACHYVLQFVPQANLDSAIRNLIGLCRPGGLLLFAEKHGYGFWGREPGSIANAISRNYYKWRASNGYTQEEIDAKSAALQNSMFERSAASIEGALRGRFDRKFDTFRFGPFRGFAAMKNR